MTDKQKENAENGLTPVFGLNPNEAFYGNEVERMIVAELEKAHRHSAPFLTYNDLINILKMRSRKVSYEGRTVDAVISDYFSVTIEQILSKMWSNNLPTEAQATLPVSEQLPVSDDKPLTECMMGRDGECNHPKCPITDEDERNGKYCPLPLYDYRQ